MDWHLALQDGFGDHWHIWLLSAVMVVGAVIDGVKLKVPNWLTIPLILGGWVFSAVSYAMDGNPWYQGFFWSLAGTAVGLLLLLPAYSIGGMGAGDVKLLVGCGAWVYPVATFYAFCFGAVIGGVLAILMVLVTRTWNRHYQLFWKILAEIVSIRQPEKLSELAAQRKPSMMKLPYGIPITLGALLYFAWTGMLI